MPFKAAKCPNCAGDIQVPDDRDTAKCMYCGSDIIVREAIKALGGKNLNNILEMAKTALESGNKEEGLKYINSYLEEDQNNAEAWHLKTQLICLEYNYGDIFEVVKQVESYMLKAIALNKEYETTLENYKMRLAESLWNYINSNTEIYNEVKFKANTSGFSGVYYHDAPEVKEKLRSEILASVVAYITILPQHYHKDTLPKIKQINQWLRKEGTSSPWLDNFIQKYDVQYVAPPAKTCFIATATYGSPMALEVTVLREFRDSYLENTFVGKFFVSIYYHLSPPIARLISKSKFLRVIIRQFLKPIIYLVKIYGRTL